MKQKRIDQALDRCSRRKQSQIASRKLQMQQALSSHGREEQQNVYCKPKQKEKASQTGSQESYRDREVVLVRSKKIHQLRQWRIFLSKNYRGKLHRPWKSAPLRRLYKPSLKLNHHNHNHNHNRHLVYDEV